VFENPIHSFEQEAGMNAKKDRFWRAMPVLAATMFVGGLIAYGNAARAVNKIKSQNEGVKIMKIRSSVFENGQPIPIRYTGEGKDVSPPLEWSGAPDGTKEFALICDDPDAPTPQPWVHWVIYKISPKTTKLPEGLPRQASLNSPVTARQGKNSWDTIGYRGPMPPPGHGVHHYYFALYALNAELDVPEGVDKATLLNAMQGHILLKTELIGTYKR
jgi:Raf kinase inhibitor-like YbhB/YbcL family protein